MAKPIDLNQIIARNLRYFMARPSCEYRTANALAIACGLAPNTVRNYLAPSKRTVTAEKPEGYPTLDKLGIVAEKLRCELWELLHPNIERSMREREMYRTIESDFQTVVRQNQPSPPPQPSISRK